MAAGTPAQVKRAIAGTPCRKLVENNPGRYARLSAEHLAGLREIAHSNARLRRTMIALRALGASTEGCNPGWYADLTVVRRLPME